MLRLKVIGTGSSGNCYFLQDEETRAALLLDAGLKGKRIIRALGSLTGIQGCLITHEHMDHAAGLVELAALGVDVYATKGTLGALGATSNRIHEAELMKTIQTADFMIIPFETQHDAAEPCGFLIRHLRSGAVILYATDTYYVRYTFPGVHFWLVECNYVEEIVQDMERRGEMSGQLHRRLLTSHMSLRRLKDALAANDLTAARKIVLLHLSSERSDEARMVREVSDVSGVETVAAVNGAEIELSLSPF